MTDSRLAIPAACGWLAAAIITSTQHTAIPVLVAAWLIAGAFAFLYPRLSLAAAAVALCSTSVAMQLPARQPDILMEAASHHRSVTAVATTTQTVHPGEASFEAQLDSAAEVAMSVPVLVFNDAVERRLEIGSTVVLVVTVVVAEPGDDRAFLLFAHDPPTVVRAPPWNVHWANELRSGLLSAAQSLPGDGGDLLAGLAIGDTSAVSDSLDDSMKASSLSHLTAVSGANCAVVTGLVLLAGAALRFPRWLRIVASITALLGFVVLVTPEPSVLRAALMAAIALAALASGRPTRGLPALSLATVSLLIFDPWLARNYGFVLSILATAGLLLLSAPLARVCERWVPRWLALLIVVPVAAQLACQPVLVLLDDSLPFYGVVANVLAAPAAPVATVIGLAACIFLTLFPPLGLLLCQLAWLPAAWVAAVATFFAGAPGARLPWLGGMTGAALLLAVSALAVASLLSWGRWRRCAVTALVVLGVGYSGTLAGGYAVQQFTRPAHWQIAGCDVGQGDAFIVRSAGKIALIDTGPDPALLAACLRMLGIDRIDLLVLTHYDLDHVGGIEAVMGKVDQVIVGPTDQDAHERVIADFREGGADVQQVNRGHEGILGELRWHLLWPPERLAGIDIGNSSSLVIEFDPVGECRSGCLSSVFLGDVDQNAQQRILAMNSLNKVTVVKVAHHGSADQEPQLYERFHAIVGLLGVGADNGYGHPAQGLLEILSDTATTTARTDEHGLILLSPGDELGAVAVWTER
ncbi:MAG: ComEC/Rec2 family competence protein [Rhodoglobus sp.]